MKNSTRNFTLCVVLILGSFLPVAMQAEAEAEGNQGHHQSGIIGRVQVEQIGVLVPWQVRVTTDVFEPVAVLPTDEDGHFIVNLKPGTYHLNAFVGGDGGATLAGPPVRVTVAKKDFTLVELPLGSGPQ